MDVHPADRALIKLALKEDIGGGDITTAAVIPPSKQAEAEFVAKSPQVVAGLHYVREVFKLIDRSVLFEPLVEDGKKVRKGAVIARVSGSAGPMLAGERLSLNILQHLSGIATLTASFVRKLEGTRARVLDTRKTTPGMRRMEKYAVTAGGGENHRMGLYDGVLLKDNHLSAAGTIKRAVRLARKSARGMKIEVECTGLAEVREALSAGADVIMLDNMDVKDMARAVKIIGGRALTEASGNVTLRNIRDIAMTGVDFISVGALTHSAPASDISLRFL